MDSYSILSIRTGVKGKFDLSLSSLFVFRVLEWASNSASPRLGGPRGAGCFYSHTLTWYVTDAGIGGWL